VQAVSLEWFYSKRGAHLLHPVAQAAFGLMGCSPHWTLSGTKENNRTANGTQNSGDRVGHSDEAQGTI